MKKCYALVLLCLLPGFNVFSQTLMNEGYVTDGTVRAIAREGNTVYIGGDFNYVGPGVPYGASLDMATGLPDLSFAKPNEGVVKAIPDGSGGWFIGGDFTVVGGQVRNHIARINSDGSLHPWNPNASAAVTSFIVSGNTVYVGGRFTSIGGNSRRVHPAGISQRPRVQASNPGIESRVLPLCLSQWV